MMFKSHMSTIELQPLSFKGTKGLYTNAHIFMNEGMNSLILAK